MTEPFPERSEGMGWSEYVKDQRLILSELKRFNGWLNEIDKRLNNIDTRLAVQEFKAGVWGLLGGLIAVALALAVGWLKSGR